MVAQLELDVNMKLLVYYPLPASNGPGASREVLGFFPLDGAGIEGGPRHG